LLQPSSVAAIHLASMHTIVPLSHTPSYLSKINKHQLPILANADEAISPRPMSFSICWWLILVSSSICVCCRWYFSSGKSLFFSLEQQDQLILSALLSSLSMDVLHLVVDCQTLHSFWCTFEQVLASPPNSRFMQLHNPFQDLRQGDDLVTKFIKKSRYYLMSWSLLAG